MIDLRRFAREYNVRKPPDGDHEIVGKFGVIYAYDGQRLAWMLLNKKTARYLNKMKREHGDIFEVFTEGDEEAVFLFEPEHLRKVAALAGVRRKKKYSPKVRRKFAKILERARECKKKGKIAA